MIIDFNFICNKIIFIGIPNIKIKILEISPGVPPLMDFIM